MDSDDYFELMMRNAWHISGGDGWCSNTTNKRVLVTHSDGSQTVEEIKDDLGLKEGDTAGMVERLRRQGVEAASLDTKGGVGSANVAADIPGAALMKAQDPENETEANQEGIIPVSTEQAALAPTQPGQPYAQSRLASSAPGSRRHSEASNKSNASAPAHIPSPRQALNYSDIAVNLAKAKVTAVESRAPSSQERTLGEAVRPPPSVDPALVVGYACGWEWIAAVQRRKDGARAPQYTREQMEMAAMWGRADSPCRCSA